MRVTRVSTVDVGGLVDATLELPERPIVALAGGNGTGKSKLLACILSPWSSVIPAARPGREARVEVHLTLSSEERLALAEYSEVVGWGAVEIPENIAILTTTHPTVGVRRDSRPSLSVLQHGLANEQFAQSAPSLNVVYLPAERRLIPPGIQGIDLNQLTEVVAWQKTAEPRNAVTNYGRLDDQEFEGFAKALCVASALPSEDSQADLSAARTRWENFRDTVNSIIAPKSLLPLTRENPDQLRIETPSGDKHPVQELSSGERQALIIVSRVIRAGARQTLVLIDEPDAYLHPHLSQRLVQALEQAVRADGRLIVATHSPSILDSLPPSAIVRLGHEQGPRLVADEDERLDLYRSAGFRASTLTQSDLLMIAEGETDAPLLRLLLPELARAAIRSAGGRARVLREVEQLSPHGIPVLGVLDRDILAPEPSAVIGQFITIWATADIEGLILSDPQALEIMVRRGLVKRSHNTVEALQSVLSRLVDSQQDNVVAELAQRLLRANVNWEWPTPKGHRPIERLQESVRSLRPIAEHEADTALLEARRIWNEQTDTSKWQLVRGKYVLNQFASEATEMRSGRALLDAIAHERPSLGGLTDLRHKIEGLLT